MSPARPLQLGSVVWAELEDANGYRKVRPVAVVTPTANIDAGQPVRVVAITTRLVAASMSCALTSRPSKASRLFGGCASIVAPFLCWTARATKNPVRQADPTRQQANTFSR